MIKGIIIKSETEQNFIQEELKSKGISVFNTFFDKEKKVLSWFENEDYQNTGIGFNILKEGVTQWR